MCAYINSVGRPQWARITINKYNPYRDGPFNKQTDPNESSHCDMSESRAKLSSNKFLGKAAATFDPPISIICMASAGGVPA